MPPPNVLNTELSSRTIAASVLQDVDAQGHASAITSLIRIIRAVEELGRVIGQARPQDSKMSAEVRFRASELIRDVPAVAAHAYRGEEQADRQGDRSLAHVMGQIAGRTRHAISSAGGDGFMQPHSPSNLEFPTWDDKELSLRMLHMTPAEMTEAKGREASARAAYEAANARLCGSIKAWADRGFL
jgi:hypothetical protein